MTTLLLLLACGAAALAAALLGHLAVLRLRSPRGTDLDSEVLRLPPLLAAACRFSAILPSSSFEHLPPRWLAAQARLLARAGFLGLVDGPGWSRLLAAAAIAGLVVWSFGTALFRWPPALALPCAAVPPLVAASALRGRARRRAAMLLKELPAALDVLVLCLEAGAALTAALRITCEKSAPGPLRDLLASVLQKIRAGHPRMAALRAVLAPLEIDAFTTLLSSLVQAELTGSSLGPALRAQAAQAVTERFLQAERMAMQAPVKLLGPLLFCIFPCTFIVIGVPIAARLIGAGAP